jgi:hypothetical protein
MPRRKNLKTTHVAILLDKSGSMGSFDKGAILAAFNERAEAVRDLAGQDGQEATVSLFLFDNIVRPVFVGQGVRFLKTLGPADYYPGGGTALMDTVNEAVETLDDLPRAAEDDTSFLLMVITDGEDVSSRMGATQFKKLIQACEDDGRWTVVFSMPKGYADRFSRDYGVPRGNCREWEQSTVGLQEDTYVTRGALAGYFQGRGQGMKKSTTFYVDTDLSKVTTRQVKRTLVDLSGRFRAFTVGAEADIQSFVVARTMKPYVVGSTYYQLTKPEKVQPNKNVVIMEKGKPAVYGGDEARDLIGLPTDGVSHAKVTPGNHANYDIFVQSTSTNRKLVRGTKVLVDTTHVRGLKPTWAPVTA